MQSDAATCHTLCVPHKEVPGCYTVMAALALRKTTMHDRIPTAFISFAATELTNNGLSGPKLVEITSAYAADFSVDIPHARYPFDAPNKRTALLDNLLKFSPKQQYQIIRELCDRLNANGDIAQLVTLKTKLFREYRDFADQDNLTAIHETQIIEARHWLADYPDA